jgi:hypothetical protein
MSSPLAFIRHLQWQAAVVQYNVIVSETLSPFNQMNLGACVLLEA